MNVYLKSYFACLVLGFSVQAVAGSAKVNDEEVRILGVDGNVKVWLPWGTNWLVANGGTTVPINTLIKVEQNSKATLSFGETQTLKNLGYKEGAFTLQHPMILRLTSDVLRTIQNDPFYIKSVEAVVDSKNAIVTEIPEMKFSEASRRDAALLYKDLNRLEMEKLSKQLNSAAWDTVAQSRIKRIEMLFPQKETVVPVFSFPSNIRTHWVHPKKMKGQFYVYLWDSTSQRKGPTYVTSKDSVVLSFFEEGRYFFQVASYDGSYQSALIELKVFFHAKLLELGQDMDAEKIVKKGFYDVQPPEVYHHDDTGERSAITFSWNYSGLNKNRFFRLIVQKQGGKRRIKTLKHSSATLELEPGRYRWYVEAVHKVDEQIQIETMPDHDLSIIASGKKISRFGLKKAVTEGDGETWYLESGLP